MKLDYTVRVLTGEGQREVRGSAELGGALRLVLDLPQGVLLSAEARCSLYCSDWERIFMNGFQSWSYSPELRRSDRIRSLRRLPRSGVRHYGLDRYGDDYFVPYPDKPGFSHGESWCYLRDGERFRLLASLSERAGFTAIRFFARQNRIELARDCRGLVITKPYAALEVAQLSGAEDEVFDLWFALQNVAPPTVKPITGYTSWYNYYQDISEEKILANLAAVENSPVKFDVFQIDDGYQTAVGDWLSIDKNKFPNGLKDIAARTRAGGMTPGIWMAPFSAQKNSKLAKQHPDWLLRGDDGKPIRAGANWGGFYALDLYHPEARDYIRSCLQTAVRDWGFGLLKLDFLYCVCLKPTAEHTRGEIMFDAMDFIRQSVPEAKILGCGVPLAAAFGKVEYCRIGCDVGLDLDDKPIMRLIHRERVSTKNSQRNTVFRRGLNGRAFWNDPDVFLLRDDNIELTWEQRETLARVNALYGGVKFTSDNVSGYHDAQKKVLRRVLASKFPEKTTVTRRGRQYQVEADGEVFYI